jgi:hypothetical protein
MFLEVLLYLIVGDIYLLSISIQPFILFVEDQALRKVLDELSH